jgi:hypothetical protein
LELVLFWGEGRHSLIIQCNGVLKLYQTEIICGTCVSRSDLPKVGRN